MAKFNEYGDLRETALPRIVIDWETGEALFTEEHAAYVQGTVVVDDGWTVDWFEDVTDDDSSKQWQVPANQEWHVFWVDAVLATSAAAGDRQLELRVQRPGATDYVTLAKAGAVQAASLTRRYHMAEGVADLTGFRDTDWLSTPITVACILRAGDTLRLWDNKQIAPAADDLHVWVQYAYRAA